MIPHRSCTLCAYEGEAPQCPNDGSPTIPSEILDHAPSPRKNVTIGGRYQLLNILGRGGMGEVWFGQHTTLRQPVAVKLIRDDALETQGARARFEREALLVSRLQHPHVVRVFDFGYEADFGAYLVMEYLEGVDLAGLIKANAPLPIDLTVHIAKQVASALCGAHQRGLVHRDLKPANIFLQNEAGVSAFVKVLDFGIAKPVEPNPEFETITRSGAVVGSPPYMAPEQAMSKELSSVTDLYALGVVAYEMLEGKRPFTGESPLEILMKHVKESPPPLTRDDIPHALRGLISELLQKAPGDRPPNAEHVLEILNELVRDISHTSNPRGPWASLQHENNNTKAPTSKELASGAHTTLPIPAKGGKIRSAAVVFIGLGLGFWAMSDQNTANGPLPALDQANSPQNVQDSLEGEYSNSPTTDIAETVADKTKRPPAQSQLILNVFPTSAHVFLRARKPGASFERIPDHAREFSLSHGHYELKVTARKKKTHRQQIEVNEDISLQIRLQDLPRKPRQESSPSLPE